jgi:tripartite-type tricarboxylate transporter receptor subunit TctC
MPMGRRRILVSIGAGIFIAAAATGALAQSYPTRPIHLVVGFPAGGPNDTLGRLIANWLSGRLGQPVIVDNIPGASGNNATEAVVRAAPDGYTLLLAGPANAIGPAIHDNPKFNFLRDIAPVGGVTREPLIMVVHPSVQAKNVPEFIAYAKANPGKVIMASAGNGSSPHVTGLLFKSMTGLDLKIVHYGGGGPALKALAEGNAQMMFEPASAAIKYVKSGKLRALAVTTERRSAKFPDIPAMAEFVPGYEASAATGIGAPAHTSAGIIDRLNKEINAAFSDPAMRARLDETGGAPLPGSPAAFGKLMADETAKWGRVIKSAGAKP